MWNPFVFFFLSFPLHVKNETQPLLPYDIMFVINKYLFVDIVDCTFGSFGCWTERRFGTRHTLYQEISSIVLSDCWKYLSNVRK